MNEKGRLERLRALFGGTALPSGVTVAIGDDAAVLLPAAAPLVWTIDAAVSGIHFRREWMSLEDVGFRSLMAAASDLAAMGAAPRGVLSALVLPPDFGDDELDALARGQAEAARALGTAVLGGNLSGGTELSITTCLIGEAKTPLLRAGARDKDIVAIAGAVGLAAAGLEALRRGIDEPRLAPAIAAYRRTRALIDRGLAASGIAHAAIDVSDGLAIDASRVGTESGLAVVFEEHNLLSSDDGAMRDAANVLSLEPLELALFGGEDYALLATFGPGTLPPGFVRVGHCAAGRGVWLEQADGTRREIEPRGFDHF